MRPQNDRALPAAVASKHAKNEDLEVLRAVAIGFTILAHFPALLWYASEFPTNNRYFNFGSGVDLFFCISGFIITRSILESRSRRLDSGPFGEFAFPFWIKRFFRLAPSAWLWIAVGVSLSFPLDKTGFYAPFNVNFKEGLTALLQVANFEVAMCRPKNEWQPCDLLVSGAGRAVLSNFSFSHRFLLPASAHDDHDCGRRSPILHSAPRHVSALGVSH
ncbi:hypothetical protein BSFA1_22100 [Burkholderia sp. SFA1]|nr:hypothetical protein BSFA1_22100 [Burkholderia sp. SFA1]